MIHIPYKIIMASFVIFFAAGCSKTQTILPIPQDKYDLILKASSLRDQGILTEEEFLLEKSKLLSELSMMNQVTNETQTFIDQPSTDLSSVIDNNLKQDENITLTKCEIIQKDFESLPVASLDTLCLGHKASLDYYLKLQQNDCDDPEDLKKLIAISKTGSESSCVDRQK